MKKCRPLQNQTNDISFEGIDGSYLKMYFLLNLSHYVKSYGHLCQILAFFTMPALQIWPCHVTQEANFEKVLFFPNSAFNIGKSCKIPSRKALYFRSYQPKTSQGVENTPPSAFRVNGQCCVFCSCSNDKSKLTDNITYITALYSFIYMHQVLCSCKCAK